MLRSIHKNFREQTGYARVPDIEMTDFASASGSGTTGDGVTRHDNGLGALSVLPPELVVDILKKLDVPSVDNFRLASRGARLTSDNAGRAFWQEYADSLGPIRLDAQPLLNRSQRLEVPISLRQRIFIGLGYTAALAGAAALFWHAYLPTKEHCTHLTAGCDGYITNATLAGFCLEQGRPYPGPGCATWNTVGNETINDSAWIEVEKNYQTCNFRARRYCESVGQDQWPALMFLGAFAIIYGGALGRITGNLTDYVNRRRAGRLPRARTADGPKALAAGRLEQVRLLGGSLRTAINNNQIDSVRRLVRCGFASAAPFRAEYPLTQALNREHFAIAEALVDANAIPNDPMLVDTAVRHGTPATLLARILKSGHAPTAVSFKYAVDNNQDTVVQTLIDAAENPTRLLARCNPETLLVSALNRSASYGLVETLLALGVPADAQRDGEATPLHIAVSQQRPNVVNLLLSAKGNPSTLDEHGRTPIALARENRIAFPFA